MNKMESILDDINNNLMYIPLVPIDYCPFTLNKMTPSIKLHLQIIHLDLQLKDKLKKIYGHGDYTNLQLLYLNVFYRKSLRIHYELKYANCKVPYNILKHKENDGILRNLLNLFLL